MRKLILSIAFAVCIFISAGAQITKSDITTMLAQTGLSANSIDEISIKGWRSYYTDGTRAEKISDRTYKKVNGDQTNKISVSEGGIIITTYKAGKGVSSRIVPYESMAYFYLDKEGFVITLKRNIL